MIRIIAMLILLLPLAAQAKIKVVASTAPIAGLIAMVAGDEAEISIIANTAGCPHHYSLKPSDLKKAEDADLFVYIDDDFDEFATLLLPKSHAKIIKISALPGLKLIENNLHLWLLPENAIAIMNSTEKALSEISRENKAVFKSNLEKGVVSLQMLEQERQQVLLGSPKFILLTDSAEYLFLDSKASIQKSYDHEVYAGIKTIDKLKNEKDDACFIISMDQDLDKYQNILGKSSKVIQLCLESWQNSENLENLYYTEYEKILKKLSSF